MIKRLIAFFTFVIILGFSFQSIAQLTQEELAERGKWEKFLRTAKIIKGVDIGEGITKPKRLFFKKGYQIRTASKYPGFLAKLC